MAEILDIVLQKTQLPNGSWVLYYPGTNLDLSCGTYYLKVMIAGAPWYSELFTVKTINSDTHPGLIKDTPHTALRFYDSVLKQTYYKCEDLCDLTINPVDHIVPFVIDLTGYGIFAASAVKTKIICHDGSYEYDLSSELQYEINTELRVLIQKGNTLSSQLYCGVYYLEVSVPGSLFQSDFSQWVPAADPEFPSQPIGFLVTSDYTHVSISNDYNRLRLNILGQTGGYDDSIRVWFNPPVRYLFPGTYTFNIHIDDIDAGAVGGIALHTLDGQVFDLEIGGNTVVITLAATTSVFFMLTKIGSYVISDVTILGEGNEVKLYSEHLKIANVTNIQTGETFLYTESGSGFEPIITGDDEEIILNL